MARTKEKRDLYQLGWGEITGSYLLVFTLTLALFGALCIFWSEYALFSIDDLWSRNDDLLAGLGKVWFIFVWGAGITLLMGILLSRMPREYPPRLIFGQGMWISLNAGIFEELIYRWLRFSIAMITLPFFNLITFGFLKWVYITILIPVANWVTFGALQEYLFHPASWVIGAAIISANGSFRDGHKENGFFSWVNSWFLGMVFFFLMFNYGLLTAIVAHVLYDMAIFVVAALGMSWRPVTRSREWMMRSRRSYNYRR